MRTPTGGLRPALILIAALAALMLPGRSVAAHCNDHLELHPGSCGQRVKDLQWLLGAHRPNVFTEVKATFKWKPNGEYGARTKSAVTSWKYRIGYPRKGQCGARVDMVNDHVGAQFFAILRGRQKRPACWVALVSGRLRAIKAAHPTMTALAWKAAALSQLGITESPLGTNRGPCISSSYGCFKVFTGFGPYQGATGAYGAAWCVSFQQWLAKVVGYGRFANGTAGVYYAVDYYAARNLVFAKPKFGSLVAFITYDRYGHRVPGTGHMGFVTAVQANSFTYVAGNDGNAVREHTIPDGSRPYLFIRLPGIA